MNRLRPTARGTRSRWLRTVAVGSAAMLLTGSLILARSPAAARPSAILNAGEIVPGHYITNYPKVAKVCPDFAGYVWASWITYATATLGDQWISTASSTSLCPFGAKSVKQLINVMAFRGGTASTNAVKIDQQGYALLIEKATHSPTGAARISKSVPSGWKCFALQSFWGMSAWNAAQLAHAGEPADNQFAAASGPGAGSGFCVSGARKDATGAWQGGQFFTWAPDTRTCKRRYKLHETPDPANPNNVKYSSYTDVRIWDDYDRVSC